MSYIVGIDTGGRIGMAPVCSLAVRKVLHDA
jgi:hypothetical protein